MKEGWETIDLGSICHVQRGLTYSGKDTVDISDQVVLRATNIDLGTGKLIFDELKYLREDLEIKPVYALKKDSLLICFSSGSKSHLGKIALVDDDYHNFFFGGFIGQINPSEKIDSKYLFYCLSSETYKDYISNLTDGVNINNLKATDLKSFQIRLPPLPEQQRIVSILDRAFAAIDKAKANAEQNLQNAKELFESYLQGVFENGNWEAKEFGEIITTLTDYHANGSYKILKKNVTLKETEDFAWMVRSTDFENDFQNDFRYIDEYSYNFLSKSKVFGGEIIMSKIGNTGNVYLMPRIDNLCSLAMNLFLIRLDEGLALPEFVYQYLKSYSGEFQIKSRLQGATTKTITKNNVRNIKVPVPPLNVQQTIVRQLDALRAETQNLEAVYQKKMDDLEELKKSILQKAFAGELHGDELVESETDKGAAV